ncbi:MAG: hypothetical protein ACYDHM_12580 [Acidiferrobacterales bacterium]
MNRTPWTVEEELARLKAEIQEKQTEPPGPEHSDSREDGPPQQIQGHHNVQVAGDLTVHARKEVNPNHPDAIRCPQCQGLTYQRSDCCAECHFNLRHHRIERARKEKTRRLMHMIVLCGIPGLLMVFAGTKFFAGAEMLYFLGVGGGLLGAAALAALRLAQI